MAVECLAPYPHKQILCSMLLWPQCGATMNMVASIFGMAGLGAIKRNAWLPRNMNFCYAEHHFLLHLCRKKASRGISEFPFGKRGTEGLMGIATD